MYFYSSPDTSACGSLSNPRANQPQVSERRTRFSKIQKGSNLAISPSRIFKSKIMKKVEAEEAEEDSRLEGFSRGSQRFRRLTEQL